MAVFLDPLDTYLKEIPYLIQNTLEQLLPFTVSINSQLNHDPCLRQAQLTVLIQCAPHLPTRVYQHTLDLSSPLAPFAFFEELLALHDFTRHVLHETQLWLLIYGIAD